MNLEEKYQLLKETPSDINTHFDTIRKYVEKCDCVVELGVREMVSTYALMANRPGALLSVDVVEPPKENLDEAERIAKEAGVVFKFFKEDSVYLDVKPIDVLFIDTLHLYSQIVKELWRHAPRVQKYIIFHDSHIPEVRACIQDFLFNQEWKLVEDRTTNTGLCVVKRI